MKDEKIIIVGMVLIVALAFMVVAANAQSTYPDVVEVFHVEDRTCVKWNAGVATHVECWCTYSCEPAKCEVCDECEDCEECKNCEDCEECEQCEQCQECPECPQCEEKKNCNKGEGNLGEGCDPGNNPDKGNDDEDG